MLTLDKLKNNAELAKLDDAILQIVANLSEADENSVIAAKTKKDHQLYDDNVFEITGEKKPGDQKTYDFIIATIKKFKKAADDAGDTTALLTEITTLKKEKEDLQEQIKKGNGDPALKLQITQLEQSVKDKESELTTVKTRLEKETTELTTQLETARKGSDRLEMETGITEHVATAGIKFKPGLDKDLLSELIKGRKTQLFGSITPDFIKNSAGEQQRVFRDGDNEIIRNSKEAPATIGEIWEGKITDLVDPATKKKGSGTIPPGGGGGSTGMLDLTGADTQVKADEQIRTYLLREEGLAKTDPKFDERHMEIRQENNVAELPVT